MVRRRRPPRSGALTELRPLKILSQIAALQIIYYLAATILILFTTLVSGTKFSLDLIFSWRDVRADATTGWVWGFIWLFDGGLVVAIAIIALVSRSKLVPDFVVTLQLIHLTVVMIYTDDHQFPQNPFWWLIMVASSALSIALGVWGCRYRELKPITFGGLGANSNSGAGSEENGDEEQGLGRGRGRGRGRDGNGEYELANMDSQGEGGASSSR